MNTSAAAVEQLETALNHTKQAANIINDLIAAHDYQDVASLVSQAAAALLESAALLMKKDDEGGVDKLASADDILDSVWAIIDGEVEDDE